MTQQTESRLSLDCIASVSVLEDVLERIATVDTECRLEVTEGGLRSAVASTDLAYMVHVEVPLEPFESFQATEDLVGLPVDRVSEALELAESNDELVHLEHDAQERKFHLSGDGWEVSIRGIDPTSIRKEPDLPEVEWSVIATFDPEHVHKSFQAVQMVTSHLELSYDADGETFHGVGKGDLDAVDVDWTPDETEHSVGDASAVYSRYIMRDVLRGMGTEPLTVSMCDEHRPARIEQPFADGHGECTWHIAPIVPGDDA